LPDAQTATTGAPLRGLHRAFLGLTVAVVGLMVLGALVRAHGAGLACPDWPLCFGEFVPRFDLKIAFEWGHRVFAGTIALVYVGLLVACFKREETRRQVGGTLVLGLVVLVAQVILGALTVWQLLAAWSVTSHLLTANAFAICVVFVAVRLHEEANGNELRPGVGTGLRWAVSLTMALLVFQVGVGGLVASTYAGVVCPEWPACVGGVWFPGFEGARGFHLVHRLAAYTLLVALLACAVGARGLPRIGQLLAIAFWLGLAQAAVGVANVLLRLPVEVTGLHSALAAILMLTLALATREAWRMPRTATPPTDPSVCVTA